MYILYTDDSILAAPTQKEVDEAIKDIQEAGLIKQIWEGLGMNLRTKPKKLPACSSKILKRHGDSEAFDESFHYRSIVGKLNYLEKGTRPDISYFTHQCARFVQEPKKEHGAAIRQLARSYPYHEPASTR